MPTNSFNNFHTGEQYWAFADVTLVAGAGTATWRRGDNNDTVVFLNSMTGVAEDPLRASYLILSGTPLGTLTVNTSSTGVTVTSTNAADAVTLRIFAEMPLIPTHR